MTIRMRIRNHQPQRTCTVQYADYRRYKSSLRADFQGHCGYCDDYDGWIGGVFVYHIDHFAPKKKFPFLSTSYGNLVYACPYCNRGKGDYWPSTDHTISVVAGEGFIDPTTTEYHDHISRDKHGRIVSDSSLGNYIIRRLHLYLERHRIIWNLTRIQGVIDQIGTSIQTATVDGELKRRLEHSYIDLNLEFHKYLKYLLGDIASGNLR